MYQRPRPDGLLRTALRSNGAFSLICAGVLGLGGSKLAPAFGLASAWPLRVIALGLLPFAAFVFWQAKREKVRSRDALATILGDLAWVAGTALLLLEWPEQLNQVGKGAALAIAACVGALALAQTMGLRRIIRARYDAPHRTPRLELEPR